MGTYRDTGVIRRDDNRSYRESANKGLLNAVASIASQPKTVRRRMQRVFLSQGTPMVLPKLHLSHLKFVADRR